MSFIGLTPFLRPSKSRSRSLSKRCQCPSSGLLHFYISYLVTPSLFLRCVNALHQAYSISTLHSSTGKHFKTRCQCPSSGLLHFYVIIMCIFITIWMVSMPFIRLTPFLPDHRLPPPGNQVMCQCPSSGLLHFYYWGK